MFSPLYSYYNICSDIGLSKSYSTTNLIHFLRTIPELEQTGEFHFSNKKSFSYFISITLLHAKNYNSWSDNDANINNTNLLVIVTARPNNAPPFIQPILQKISKHLNWQLIDEADSEENEIEEDDDTPPITALSYSTPPSAPYRYNDEDEEDDEEDDEEEEDEKEYDIKK